jgi:hypothetical protein
MKKGMSGFSYNDMQEYSHELCIIINVVFLTLHDDIASSICLYCY